MPPPFVSYLRVYEPLSAFDPDAREQLERALLAGPLDPGAAGNREREMWLRAQLAAPPQLLPGERTDAVQDLPPDLLAIDATAVDGVPDTAGPLVCPLDLHTRSAAALVGFMATASPSLMRVALPAGPRAAADAVRSRAETVIGEHGSSAVHVVSSTWTVPLPWFALVRPEERQTNPAPRPDPDRRVWWWVPLAEARHRAARAQSVVTKLLGEAGPVRVLGDTNRWLSHFHPESVVELDYGGLVQLMDDEVLLADASDAEVQAVVDAIEDGRGDAVSERYQQLREFWAAMAAFERLN